MKLTSAIPGLLMALIVLPPSAGAYDRKLSSAAIQEAYNLGRNNNQETAVFLAQYFRPFSTPDKGLYAYSIEVLTPYAQLVNDAMTDMINENIYDVERKYASRAGVILVRVRVYSTPTSSLPFMDEGIWKEITIEASQKDVLKPGKKSLNHVYPGDDSGPFDYANLELQFDAKDVASAPLTIAVSTSDGQRVETRFDLAKLK